MNEDDKTRLEKAGWKTGSVNDFLNQDERSLLLATVREVEKKMKRTKYDKRFQYQSWIVKLWRLRHYFLIPYTAFKMWRSSPTKSNSLSCWSIAIGLAQYDMKWYYEWEELANKNKDKNDQQKSQGLH